METTKKIYLATHELAEMIGCSSSQAYKMIREINAKWTSRNRTMLSKSCTGAAFAKANCWRRPRLISILQRAT